MKYNNIYTKILNVYGELKIIQLENGRNFFNHKPTLSEHDDRVIREISELLKQALDIIEPETCKTMINKNEFMTAFIYEEGK